MMQDDPKKSEGALPGQVSDVPGKRSGSGADTAFKEMRKRQTGQHVDNEPAQSENTPDSSRSQP